MITLKFIFRAPFEVYIVSWFIYFANEHWKINFHIFNTVTNSLEQGLNIYFSFLRTQFCERSEQYEQNT